MEPLQEFGEDAMVLHVLIKLVQHPKMLLAVVLVCFSRKMDIGPNTWAKLIDTAFNLQ